MNDLKPRSHDVTTGIAKAASRAMLRAVGMGEADWVKPQIGVASSWNEVTPCNLSLDRLAKKAKEGVFAAGGFPMQFGTISVSDGISMGHIGMHGSLVSREVICDSVETVIFAERMDGVIGLAGCDKSLPGMLMAMARLDPRQAEIVELRYFGGLTEEEVATVKELSPVTIRREIAAAKFWLGRRMKSQR